ncbi:hypothetical protein [Pontimicrobium aquaticum]|uniref:Methyltransferase domain-containing protein n=1 Tax=Pontimicrobium aquaticum TaxID=2565367 RepID=A0A4U0EMT4_9FLAO|nr:hypothetical protein [Pontimicrobium aquaticum]TJY32893.1 hypothetical protein E5167_13735 [Pontimicrobium aquaticum]
MLIKKLKRLVKEYRENNKKQTSLLKELEWAHVYHDSIRGLKYIESLPINIGRWAGNYSFFYILNRVLKDCRPKRILEMGLGESSKFISTYLNYYLKESTHLIIEQDCTWVKTFESSFLLSNKSKIEICEIIEVNIQGNSVNIYRDLEHKIENNYDFYLVDGPFGSPRFSRYDIVSIAKKIDTHHQFIILLDDFGRQGERDTFYELLSVFKSRKINVFHQTYIGQKQVKIIVTEEYKFCCSF